MALLANLRDHHLLRTNEKLTPFERVAHLETFEEIPIFGGKEFRKQVL